MLDSTVHKNVVKAHDGLVEGHNKVVHDLKDLQQEVQHAVLNAPWVTPRTVDDSVQLPTLEQLLTDACKVHSDGQVAQYIRAHPAPASIAASKGASPVKSALSQLAMAGDEVANYAKVTDDRTAAPQLLSSSSSLVLPALLVCPTTSDCCLRPEPLSRSSRLMSSSPSTASAGSAPSSPASTATASTSASDRRECIRA